MLAESKIYAILAISAFALTVIVTGGIAYLTFAEWRDRRRRNQDATGSPTRTKRKKKS
ncbi:MAG: hypothetical protein AAGF66_00175 [Cyanobacteria bacterium P01_H01_bin.119]